MNRLRAHTPLWLILVFALWIVGCNDDDNGDSGKDDEPDVEIPEVDLSKPVNVNLDEEIPQYLSGFNLMDWNEEEGFQYHEGVVPYDLNTPLFSDYALKARAIYIPEGTTIDYVDNEVFDFPVGTVILKTFYFAEDAREPDVDHTLIETRVLILHEDGWQAYPYYWNEEQTAAVLVPSGKNVDIDLIDNRGEQRSAKYRVPSRNQCKSCHIRKDEDTGDTIGFLPIGPKARHINRDYVYADGEKNQLEYLEERGWLQGMPDIDDVPRAYDFSIVENDGVDSLDADALEKAAVDYLDINCAHCHSPTGVQGVSSQFFLNHDYTGNKLNRGICKQPGSAGNAAGGNTYDIVPGSAEESILYYRMHTEVRGHMMPVLARSLEHTDGTDLVKRWIDEMPIDPSCPPKDD